MVRDSNKADEWWRPERSPAGTANFANLLRDPLDAIGAVVMRELAAGGFEDLRPGLLAIGQHVPTTGSRITELAAATQLTKPTVVHAINELERLGYARRIPDPDDGRAKLVVMTERGQAAEQAGRETIAAVRAAWAQAYGAEDLAQLERLLLRLRAMLWPEAGD